MCLFLRFQNLGEVPRSVEIIISSARDLLEKCQEVQVSFHNFKPYINVVHELWEQFIIVQYKIWIILLLIRVMCSSRWRLTWVLGRASSPSPPPSTAWVTSDVAAWWPRSVTSLKRSIFWCRVFSLLFKVGTCQC